MLRYPNDCLNIGDSQIQSIKIFSRDYYDFILPGDTKQFPVDGIEEFERLKILLYEWYKEFHIGCFRKGVRNVNVRSYALCVVSCGLWVECLVH
jgi:hypothetical protein